MFKVIDRADLAGGMTAKCQLGIGFIHAAAIVSHPDGADSTLANLDMDHRSASVEGIFDQLLDHGGRPFDDFTGRYAVGSLGIQDRDDTHRLFPPLALAFCCKS